MNFWNLLGQAALLNWFLDKFRKPRVNPLPPEREAQHYVNVEKKLSDLEVKIFKFQNQIDKMEEELYSKHDPDSDEYFELDSKIDSLQFDLLMMEGEADKLREDIEDEFDDEF
ncbi:MAG: hypothetical protein NC328_03920 [Muribaculum sp.]|nr:hypothetical protein [Muribaculum sp.]